MALNFANPAGTCYKNQLNLLNNEYARRCVNPATTKAKGNFLPVLKERGFRYPFNLTL